jgi:hypothetical protein
MVPVLTALLVGGCAGEDTAASAGADPAQCSADWTTLDSFESQTGNLLDWRQPPENLSWHGDALWFFSLEDRQFGGIDPAIRSVASDGGQSRRVPAFVYDFWHLGAKLWYVRIAGRETGAFVIELFSTEARGGEGMLAAQYTSEEVPFQFALDDTHLYWSASSGLGSPLSIWRMSIMGGDAELIGSLDAALLGIELTSDRLLLRSLVSAHVLPKDGGEVKTLSLEQFADPMAMAESGVLSLTVDERRGERHPWNSRLWLSPLDGGSPQPYWDRDRPTQLEPFYAVPDGEQGWLIAATERFNDHREYLSFWAIDSMGRGRREACTAVERIPVVSVAIAPHAYYVLLNEPYRFSWKLVELPRSAH